MINLFEDYKNLNIIDRSFFTQRRYGRDENNLNLINSVITPNSKIEVNKVSPHRFTTVMEILSQDNVAGVVIRAHNRQLVFVSTDRAINRSYGSGGYNYVIVYSEYTQFNRLVLNNDIIFTDNETQVKSAISRVVKGFYDKAPEGTRKKWDILIIYKDPNVGDIRAARRDRVQNKVLTPKDKGYYEYIRKLKALFAKRAIEYIDSKRQDIQNVEDMKKFVLNETKLQRIKFRGEIYVYDDEEVYVMKGTRTSYLRYVAESGRGILYIAIKFNGLIPVVTGLRMSDKTWSSFNNAKDVSELEN